MYTRRFFQLLWMLTGLHTCLFAQVSFTNRTDLLPPGKHFSGVALAVFDWNGDGHDDIVRMNYGYLLSVEYQTAPNQPFRHQVGVPFINFGSQSAICAGDLDNDGIPEMLTAGTYDSIKVFHLNGAGLHVDTLKERSLYAQAMNLADINNDGWLDAFVCHDDGLSRVFLNDGTGNLVYVPQQIALETVPPSDGSGNYGSVWSDADNDGDVDLYIAKCRLGITDKDDGRRINQFFRNEGNGVYRQDTTNETGLRIGAQSWTADFGDIDNDGDFDCFVTNHDTTSQILENDGAGHFTDITLAAGIKDSIQGLPIQAVFRDFDNDGWVDILVAGVRHYLFHNNGNKTFSAVPVLDKNLMESFAIGDLNSDGFLDIYAGYADPYNEPSNVNPDALWINNGNNNHFIGFNLHGVQSNRSGVGAKILLYSALGTQVRELRSGESYGIMNSLQVHFGLGQVTQVDSVVVHWPSGHTDRLLHPAIDQYLTLQEGGCWLDKIEVTAKGSTTFCKGDSVTLSAPDGYSYLWNTGSAQQSVSIGVAGNYWVTVSTAAGCSATSNIVAVVVDPVEIPVITAASDTIFCAGGSVLLTASPAKAYHWSTGETTPAIVASSSGLYTVTVQATCAEFTSAPMQVIAWQPALPAPRADTVPVNSPATLTATGNLLNWYDTPVGGASLFTGSPFETPVLTQNTTYWVANTERFDFPNQFAGMPQHVGSNFAPLQTDGGLLFDCFTPFRLARVKVYTNTPGVRKIVLQDADKNILQSVSVDIPAGEPVIDLNLDVPVGINMVLKTDPAVNLAVLQTISPQLKRSDEGVNFPYELPKYLRIKTSNLLSTDRYYYFYNWEIDFYDYECQSERVAVTAVVEDSTSSTSATNPKAYEVRLLPNPADDLVRVSLETTEYGTLDLRLLDARGVVVHTQESGFQAGVNVFSLDVKALPPGMYWVELSAGGIRAIEKLILL